MCEPDEPLPDDLALCHEMIFQQADTIRESQRRIEQLEHQVEQFDELLPDVWFASHPRERRKSAARAEAG